MQVRVSRWGNSLAVRLPKAIADDLRLEEGQAVDLEIENGSVRMRPVARRKYPTLAEMVAEMERLGPENEPATEEWGPEVGAEIIDDDYSWHR
jgi:Growth regulator|nr:MAG: MazF family transcriptional regulator [Pseudomonadota bacterium]